MVGGVTVGLDEHGAHPVGEQNRGIEGDYVAGEPRKAEDEGSQATSHVTEEPLPPREGGSEEDHGGDHREEKDQLRPGKSRQPSD